MALIIWLAYLGIGLVIMPSIFRLRFGGWPFVVPLIPRNRYDIAEHVYAIIIGACTLVPLVQGHLTRPLPPDSWLGLGLMMAGLALQIWSVKSLGRWWRIGQEPGERVEHVRSGPYRFFGHPVYVSLIVIAFAVALLAEFAWWSLILLIATVVYCLVQGPLETKRLARQGDDQG